MLSASIRGKAKIILKVKPKEVLQYNISSILEICIIQIKKKIYLL